MRPALIAHRLGAGHGPDSSRLSLRAVLADDVDGLETDVCLTADGRVVLLHDPWLRQGTTFDGWAHETPWSALETAALRDRSGAATNEPPMLLEELLETVPASLALQLDVKAHGDPSLARATADAVADVVAARGGRDGLEVLSFHTAACEAAAARGLAARVVIWADYAPEALLAWAHGSGVRGVCVEHFLLHQRLVDRLQDGGLAVTTGTINDPVLAARAAALGVDAITTDRPADIRHALAVPAAAGA
ncbi:phosphodiesterase [Paraconexibacter sp. AEG42_29]|uniref:Phosphodiesterase n=1 Tax=Paraconexibacter sp. AEG42_29 TaxID=2997339 RepID=A0AAU7AU57_9ACTN